MARDLSESRQDTAPTRAASAGGDSAWRVIDLFSGAGGLSLGFSAVFDQPFRAVLANDFDSAAARTWQENFQEPMISGDLLAWLEDPDATVPESDLVIGGPPCQGFSLLNKKRRSDTRKALWRPYMEVVERSGARAFLMENVPQLLGTAEHRAILRAARGLGFQCHSFKLLAADYGVSQRRRRAFVVGLREQDPERWFPPPPTHRDPSSEGTLPPWRTVRDAIADLPPPEGTVIRARSSPLDLHFGRNPTELSRARYRAIPEEGMNRFDLQARAPELTPDCWKRKTSGGTDLFGRLWWDRPAFTIRTEFFKPEKGRYLHPVQHRPITHREAARLQSFPDSFTFLGSKTEVARQIGNAVPPRLAAALAGAMAQALSESLKGARPREGRRHQGARASGR